MSENRESKKYNFLSEFFSDRVENLDRKKNRSRAEKAINLLGVNLNPETLVEEMPVGYKQFTEIAREIERENTKLLVLDEPTAVLAEREAKVLLETIKRLTQKGISIIFITHRLHEIIDACDKVAVLRDGILIKETEVAKTDPHQITEWMIGRKLKKTEKSTKKRKFGDTVLAVENLWVAMPGEIVKDISFNVKKGEIFGIGGLAGQGKIGIANGLMGLYTAGGNVTYNNEKVILNNPKDPLKKGISFVSEDRKGIGLLLDEPVDMNIAFTALQVKENFIYKVGFLKIRNDKKIEKNAEEYVKKLEIKCMSVKQHARYLSGGNQQKVCLAKAFTEKPDLLFVSEPTRGIDVGAKKLVLDALREFNNDHGMTIIVTSSELEELRQVCDRIAIVNEGRIAGTLPAETSAVEFGELMIGCSKGDN